MNFPQSCTSLNNEITLPARYSFVGCWVSSDPLEWMIFINDPEKIRIGFSTTPQSLAGIF